MTDKIKLQRDDQGKEYFVGFDGNKVYVDIPAIVDAVRRFSMAQRELDKFKDVVDELKKMDL
jgi:hypothetical protein